MNLSRLARIVACATAVASPFVSPDARAAGWELEAGRSRTGIDYVIASSSATRGGAVVKVGCFAKGGTFEPSVSLGGLAKRDASQEVTVVHIIAEDNKLPIDSDRWAASPVSNDVAYGEAAEQAFVHFSVSYSAILIKKLLLTRVGFAFTVWQEDDLLGVGVFEPDNTAGLLRVAQACKLVP